MRWKTSENMLRERIRSEGKIGNIGKYTVDADCLQGGRRERARAQISSSLQGMASPPLSPERQVQTHFSKWNENINDKCGMAHAPENISFPGEKRSKAMTETLEELGKDLF